MSKINGKKVSKQTQLHEIVDWDVNNLVFCDPESRSVPGSVPPISFIRIGLMTKNQKTDNNGNVQLDSNGVPLVDNTMGELVFGFDKMFSFGVSETTSQETKSVTGHSMSFAMWSRDGATEREIQTTQKIEAIVQKCKEHLINIRKDGLKKPKLEMSDLKSLDKILYWKEDENGERDPSQGPTFSPKLIEYKERKDKDGKTIPYQMNTVFYLEDEVDEYGNPIEVSPLDFLSTSSEKKYCFVRPAIKFESIFFGAKVISIQCKITEADISPVQMGPQRLLHGRNKLNVNTKLNINTSFNNPLISLANETEEIEKQVSHVDINDNNDGNDNELELSDNPVVVEKKVKKVVKKKFSE